jgi:hypothetical protein
MVDQIGVMGPDGPDGLTAFYVFLFFLQSFLGMACDTHLFYFFKGLQAPKRIGNDSGRMFGTLGKHMG